MLALIRRLALLCTCAALALLAVHPACAEDELPARLERPNAIRTGAILQTGGVFHGPLWYGSWAFAYSRQVSAPLALELSGGPGVGGVRHGPHVGGAVRLSVTPRGTSALTLALGSRVAFLNGYGPVGFGDVEVAWELRTHFGLTALVGGGVGTTLTTSRRVPTGCEERRSWFGCHDDRFEAGDTGIFLHGELGWAF